MAISRMHPAGNWLRVPPGEQRRALDRVLAFRDDGPNPLASGLPPAAVDWFYQEELPRLANRPDVRPQVEERVAELLSEHARIEAQLPVEALELKRRLEVLEAEVERLEEVLGHD
jgi:hypothetical protein